MMNRRKTLMAMLTAGGAAFCSGVFGRLAQAGPGQPASVTGAGSGVSTDEAVEAALREDLARFGARAYSDEGIPVFLACENLTGEAPAQITAFNTTVAADFHRNAAAWQRIFPDAPDTDVSKVIEVLADRDFNRSNPGGRS